jgi:hypothetical protein
MSGVIGNRLLGFLVLLSFAVCTTELLADEILVEGVPYVVQRGQLD